MSCNSPLDVGVTKDTPLVFQVLMYLWNLQYYTFSISFIIIVWTSRQQLQFLLKELNEYLTTKDNETIRTYSTCLLVHKVLYLLIVETSFMFLYIWQSSQEFTWKVMLHYIRIHDWFGSGLSLYLALLKVIHLAEGNIVRKLTENIQEKSPRHLQQSKKNCSIQGEFFKASNNPGLPHVCPSLC